MSLSPSEDIRSVTDLKRNTKEILSQVHRTRRPVVLTVNGKADAVLMDTRTYEKHLKAANMARLIARAAERDIEETWNFIADDSAEEADKLLRRLEEQIETLERFPERCPLIPE